MTSSKVLGAENTDDRGSCNIFVYGTLMFEEVVYALTGKRFPSSKATLHEYRRCRIEDPARDAKGPAIIFNEDYSVTGLVLFNIDLDTLHILDLFELAAGGYERITGHVFLSDGNSVEVEFYRGTDSIRQYLSDIDWSELEFRDLYLEHYVKERISKLRRQWQEKRLLPS